MTRADIHQRLREATARSNTDIPGAVADLRVVRRLAVRARVWSVAKLASQLIFGLLGAERKQKNDSPTFDLPLLREAQWMARRWPSGYWHAMEAELLLRLGRAKAAKRSLDLAWKDARRAGNTNALRILAELSHGARVADSFSFSDFLPPTRPAEERLRELRVWRRIYRERGDWGQVDVMTATARDIAAESGLVREQLKFARLLAEEAPSAENWEKVADAAVACDMPIRARNAIRRAIIQARLHGDGTHVADLRSRLAIARPPTSARA